MVQRPVAGRGLVWYRTEQTVRHRTISPGDRFRKMDSGHPSDWVVERVIRAPGVPTHYVLSAEAHVTEVRTISEPTLLDPDFYTPAGHRGQGEDALGPDAGPRDSGAPLRKRDRNRQASEKAARRPEFTNGLGWSPSR